MLGANQVYQTVQIVSLPQQKDPCSPLMRNPSSLQLNDKWGRKLLGCIGCLLNKLLYLSKNITNIHKNTNSNLDKERWQSAMFHMKEIDKTPEENLREVEIGNLPRKVYRVVIRKMIKELRRRLVAQSKTLRSFLTER